jgi:hypothetical protein
LDLPLLVQEWGAFAVAMTDAAEIKSQNLGDYQA